MIGDRYVVVGVRKNEVIFFLTIHNIPSAVGIVGDYPRVFRQAQVIVDNFCHIRIDFDDVDLRPGIHNFHETGKGVASSADRQAFEGRILSELPFEHIGIDPFIFILDVRRVVEVYVRMNEIVEHHRLKLGLFIGAHCFRKFYRVIIAFLIKVRLAAQGSVVKICLDQKEAWGGNDNENGHAGFFSKKRA